MKGICTIAGALALAANAASAASIRLDTSKYSLSPGGEFTATVLSGNAGLVGDASSLGAGSFQTFCLEYHEKFTPGSILNVVLNTAASSATQGLDPIDPRTAFLYTRFREGSLPGYDYSSTTARKASGSQLQRAIWYLEDEAGGADNAFVALANAAVSIGGEWYGMGLGDVRAMNLFSSDGTSRQDQLTIVAPLPPGAITGLAGLCGVAGLAWLRRRANARA